MKTWKRVALWTLPLIGGGILIWWVSRAGKSPGAPANAIESSPDLLKPVPAPKNSSFPLRTGSRNGYVTQLQQALGISADGIFGSQTETALRNAAGITSIRDEKELNEVIAKIAGSSTTSGDTVKQKTARANDLFEKFATGKFSIQGLEKSFWYKVNQDFAGAWNKEGIGIYIDKGITLSKSDYSISAVTQLGNIVIYVNKGALLGSYLGDPRTITLV